jgi:hypothetical protein
MVDGKRQQLIAFKANAPDPQKGTYPLQRFCGQDDSGAGGSLIFLVYNF